MFQIPSDTLEPVSSRFFSPALTTVGRSSSFERAEPKLSGPVSATKLSNSKPENSKDANIRPSRVGGGGGIFRATGQNTIFPTRDLPAPENSVEPGLRRRRRHRPLNKRWPLSAGGGA